MLISRVGEDPKHPKIKIRRMSSELQQMALDSARRQMKNYLQSIATTEQQCQQLTAATTLRQLVENFASIITHYPYDSTPLVNNPTQSHRTYPDRQQKFFQKQKTLNEQIIRLMKNTSQLEEEVTEREAEIFGLKLKLEEKQKHILELLVKNKNETNPNAINSSDKDRSEVKIKVNQPIVNIIRRNDGVRQESSIIPLDEPKKTAPQPNKQDKKEEKRSQESWAEERKQLLKLLREKDLKIYELMRQLQQLSKKKQSE